MKKNRILALTGAACLSVALLAGCGNNGNNNTNPSANPSNDGEGDVHSERQNCHRWFHLHAEADGHAARGFHGEECRRYHQL